MEEDQPDRLIGQVIDNFEIKKVIGKGGMGVVYRAYHPALQKSAALKVMRPQLASQSGFYERFLQEARTIARLEHPNIVDVINFGKFGESYYLMMDFIDGPSLRQIVREYSQGMPIWDAVHICWQIADVLVYSHAAGVLHRDLKPDNILISHSIRPNRPYRVVVTDFGLVKLGQGSLLETQEGISLGTPAYMSPEQTRGQDVDGRTDIYALGVMLYEMVAGQRPYPIRNVFDAAKFHSSGQLVDPRKHNPEIPQELAVLIGEMLKPSLDERIASAEAATDRLHELALDIRGDKQEKEASLLIERILADSPQSVASAKPVEGSTTPTLAPAKPVAEERFFIRVSFEGKWDEKVYPLGDEPIIVGRLDTADIVLNRPGQRYVSRKHCEIILRGGRVLIRDLGSSNGTMLGDVQLTSNAFRAWSPNEYVYLGPFTLDLQTGTELEDVPSPPPGEAQDDKIATLITRPSMGYRLSCPNAVPSRLPLSPGEPIVIGRAVDCDMVLEHPHISKHHCRVQISHGSVEVVDLRSTNGTFLNDQRLPPHTAVPLKGENIFKAGPFEIGVEEREA